MRKKLACLSALALGTSFMVMGGAAATSTLTESASAAPACGSVQTFTVPAGKKGMTVLMYGADGGTGGAASDGSPVGTAGAGAGLKVKFKVKKGQKYSFDVGCGGESAPTGSGVTSTGGNGGAGGVNGGYSGVGYYCTGANSNDTPCAGSSGNDGSGGGGGGATMLCAGTACGPSAQPLAIAGAGGGGGETMCGGTNGGAGGNGGLTTLNGGAGGAGGSSGEPGAFGGVTSTGTFTGAPGNPGSQGWHGVSFGDSAGGGGGGGGFNGGNGGNGGSLNQDFDCQAGSGGGAGASWVSSTASAWHHTKALNSGGASAPGRVKVTYTS